MRRDQPPLRHPYCGLRKVDHQHPPLAPVRTPCPLHHPRNLHARGVPQAPHRWQDYRLLLLMIYFESSRFQTIIDPQLPLSSFPPYLCPEHPVFDWAEANVSIYTTWLRPSHNRRGSEVPLLRKYLLGRAGAATRKQLHSLGEDAIADRRLWRLRRRQAVLSQSNTPTISIQTTLGPIFLSQLPQSALQLRSIGPPVKWTVLLEHVQRHLETFLMAVAAVPFKSALETQPATLQQSKLISISTLLLVRLNVFCVKILLEFLRPVQTHPYLNTPQLTSDYLPPSTINKNIVKSKSP